MSSRALPRLQRAALVTGFGGPGKWEHFLRLTHEKPVPELSEGEVLVRMRARAVNPADGLAAMGLYPGFAPAKLLPATLGLEGVGEVAAAAPDVTAFKEGQRVVPLFGLGYTQSGEGSWQEYVAVREEHLVPVPDTVTDGVAAQLVVNPVTALGMLRELAVPEGEYLLQTQAGGALGRQVITLAKARGVKTINVVRRQETASELRELGADEVICSADEDVRSRVMDITGGRGAYAALESVAGDLTAQVVASTRDDGAVLIFGGAASPKIKAAISDFIFRGVSLQGFWLNRWLGRITGHKERQAVFQELFELLHRDDIRPEAGQSFDLEDYVQALKAQQEAGRHGKIILVS